MKRLFLFCFLLFASGLAQAQKLSQLLEGGDKAMDEGDFYAAASFFKKAISLDSADLSIQFKCAEASRLNYDLKTAEHWYAKIYKIDKAKEYSDALFWLAYIKKQTGNYKEAKKLFDKYIKKFKKKDNYFTRKAKIEYDACDKSMLWKKDSLPYVIEHLDTNVNSKVSEYAPQWVDSILYFSSLRTADKRSRKTSFNKIYFSTMDGEKYEPSLAWDTLFNSMGVHNANASFSPDKKWILFSRCEALSISYFECTVYCSRKEGDSWSAPVPVRGEINVSGANNTHPSFGVVNGRTVVFFSSNRNGGQGQMDIYYGDWKNGEVLNVVNAGQAINTPEDDITPFFCSPCKLLYFSSNWHPGMGGFDVFYSRFNGEFSAPDNAGYPVNSGYNDLYFSFSSDYTRAFLSSNRPGSFFEKNETCCNDIYSFKLPKMDTAKPKEPVDTTLLQVKQMKLLVPLTLYFHNDEPDNKTLAVVTKKNYASTCQDYLRMREKYNEEYSKGLKGDKKEEALRQLEVFFEDSVAAGMEDLEKFSVLLEKVLQKGEKVTITMKGYCSPLASTDYNINLAKRRVSSLRNYFREYKQGVFMPFIEKGLLVMEEEDIGELKASPVVSDDYFDVKNSVYSPLAAGERKIQIIAVAVGP